MVIESNKTNTYNIEKETNVLKLKNCKSCQYIDEKVHQNSTFNENGAKNQAYLRNVKETEYAKISAYTKALFTVYPSIPNIISVIDNIVLSRASSIVPCSGIYTGANSTYNEIEKVIDMSERKMKLLNLVALTREILSSLSEKDYEVVDMRFFKRMKTSSIAERLMVDERSVYRRLKRAVEKASEYCIAHGFGSVFMEHEIKGESWIKEIYNKSMSEFASNKLRAKKNTKKDIF